MTCAQIGSYNDPNRTWRTRPIQPSILGGPRSFVINGLGYLPKKKEPIHHLELLVFWVLISSMLLKNSEQKFVILLPKKKVTLLLIIFLAKHSSNIRKEKLHSFVPKYIWNLKRVVKDMHYDEVWFRQFNWRCPGVSNSLLEGLSERGTRSFGNGHRCGACHNAFDAQVRTREYNLLRKKDNNNLSFLNICVLFCLSTCWQYKGGFICCLGS